MNACKMTRGYTPSIFEIPRHMVSKDLIDAHFDSESSRAIERLKKEKTSKTVDPKILSPGLEIYVY